MQVCSSCAEFLKKTKDPNSLHLERSFTKIDNYLHLGFDRPDVCEKISNFVPETIVLAGTGAIEIRGGGSCWSVLEQEMRMSGLIGQRAYSNPLDALTWLAAHHDIFSRTSNPEEGIEKIAAYKVRTINSLRDCDIVIRDMFCTSCNCKLRLANSNKILLLTTNWDLGIFREFSNVIQLHGRCDYPREAVLPLQNISSLMLKDNDGLKILNSGFLPSTLLERCLRQAKSIIFWGIGLNDYDAALWHFLNDFLRENTSIVAGIASKDATGFVDAQVRVKRFFPTLPIDACLCGILAS